MSGYDDSLVIVDDVDERSLLKKIKSAGTIAAVVMGAIAAAAIFAGFRHTTIGEPMFRGGMDPTIFTPTYFSPIDVVEQ